MKCLELDRQLHTHSGSSKEQLIPADDSNIGNNYIWEIRKVFTVIFLKIEAYLFEVSADSEKFQGSGWYTTKLKYLVGTKADVQLQLMCKAHKCQEVWGHVCTTDENFEKYEYLYMP